MGLGLVKLSPCMGEAGVISVLEVPSCSCKEKICGDAGLSRVALEFQKLREEEEEEARRGKEEEGAVIHWILRREGGRWQGARVSPRMLEFQPGKRTKRETLWRISRPCERKRVLR